MIYKSSIICLLFTLYMCLFYYRKPHIEIRSTRLFRFVTCTALAVTVFDMLSLYTVNHRDTVPEAVNLPVHIIYLMSIQLYAYFLFLYMKSCLRSKGRQNKLYSVLQSLPMMLSALGVLILPIDYVQGETTCYSAGMKVYAVYVSVVVYLVLILYYCLRCWNILDSEKRLSIVLAVPIYAASAVIQFFMPEFLVSVLCTALTTMGLTFSNENTEKFMDGKTGLFNQYSFETVLDEYDFSRRKSVIGLLCFCGISNNFDLNRDADILRDIQREIRQSLMYGYRVCENGVVFFGDSEERAGAVLNKIKKDITQKYGSGNVVVETRTISESEYTDKLGLMRIIIGFCKVTGSRFAFIDRLTRIHNRNALERDMPEAAPDRTGYYVIADLNDLKIANDTVGHSAGDEMLRGFAEILSQAVGDKGRAYRQGGDEFAALYDGGIEPLLERIAELCSRHNSTYRIPISYAIGYCSLSEKGFVDIADKMMYANKREMKKEKKL